MIQTNPYYLRPFGAIALAALFSAVGAPSGASCPANAEQVQVTVSGEQITSPAADSTATIYLDESQGKTRVCWAITGLSEGYTLQFGTKEGSTASVDFGKSVQGQASGEGQRVGVPDKAGSWHYKIVLVKDGVEKHLLDPTIQIVGTKTGGGG